MTCDILMTSRSDVNKRRVCVYPDRFEDVSADLTRLFTSLVVGKALHVQDLHLLDNRRLATLSRTCIEETVMSVREV